MPNPTSFHRERARPSPEDIAIRSGLTLDYLLRLEDGTERRWAKRMLPVVAVLNIPAGELMVQLAPAA